MMQFTIHHHIMNALKNWTHNFVAISTNFIRQLPLRPLFHKQTDNYLHRISNAESSKNALRCSRRIVFQFSKEKTALNLLQSAIKNTMGTIKAIHFAFCSLFRKVLFNFFRKMEFSVSAIGTCNQFFVRL